MVKHKSSMDASTILLLLVSTDILIMIFHFMFMNSFLAKERAFHIDARLGLGEGFEYVKEFWIVLLLAALAWRGRTALYACASLLFMVILFDDVFEVHEILGRKISEYNMVPSLGSMEAKHVGEALVLGVTYLPILAALCASYWFAAAPARCFFRRFMALIAALAFFGVVCDVLHLFVPAFGFIEEAGEMVVMSIMLSYVAYHFGQSAVEAAPAHADAPLTLAEPDWITPQSVPQH